jgi:iron(III) transport system ATP-binding protein
MVLLQIASLSRLENGQPSVSQVNLEQHAFEKIAIAGETGSGKTSVLKMIAGLMQPSEGNIFLNGERILGPDEKLLPGHPAIAYLSQHFELRNNYAVIELLEMANQLTDLEAEKIYRICEIEHLLYRKTNQLSGGEKQRIALARLLVGAPTLLLLDEPFSNLDAMHKQTIKKVIQAISTELKITCIMVSHDAADMLAWADRIVVMKDGWIVQEGSPKQIYFQPADEYCAALFGNYNLLEHSTASAFGLTVEHQKKLLIRPEQFSISTTHKHGVAAVVEEIVFCGSYYLLQLRTPFQLLSVSHSAKDFYLGQQVYVQLPIANYCSITSKSE